MYLSNELQSFMGDLETSTHTVLFYSQPEGKRAILNRYIADGILKRKGIVYVYDDENSSIIKKNMESNGIDIDNHLKAGTILLKDSKEWYIENGKTDPMIILKQWKEVVIKFQKMGLGTRIIGETACFFRENKVRELLRYEYALARVLSLPMEAMCLYNLNVVVDTGNTDVIIPLMRAHEKAIFATKDRSEVFESDEVKEEDVEMLLNIKI
jgi:hypothetical protein